MLTLVHMNRPRRPAAARFQDRSRRLRTPRQSVTGVKSRTPDMLGTFTREHIVAVSLTVGPILLAGISLLIASAGSWSNFDALIRTLNVPALLISTYIRFLPLIFPLAFLVHVLTVGLGETRRSDPGGPTRIFFLWLPVLLINLIFIPYNTYQLITVALASFAGLVAFALTGYANSRTRNWLRSFARLLPRGMGWKELAVTIAVLFTLEIAALNNMWLPPEMISIKNSRLSGTGYVLEEKDGQLLVYWRNGGGIVRYKTEDVAYRQICAMSPEPKRSLAYLMGVETIKSPTYQPCNK
ncbi:hypothetical protein [Phytohabitans aurantiacus]|uniref:hypothetical protein n=1 Tax=Phytohabitans aurantiacus TaxID=3016789 RepID=UPI0024922563|nr:hypothetical protein [Phytohabitans aurantiacus]